MSSAGHCSVFRHNHTKLVTNCDENRSPRRIRSEERGAIDKASEGEPLESKCNDRRQNQKPPLTGTDDGDKVSSVSVGSSASEKGRSMERSKGE